MSFFVGVDPGKHGGYAIINDKMGKAFVFPWDDQEFVDAMDGLRIIHEADGSEIKCCVEKVSAMPGNGSVGMFRFGQSAGFIIGVLTALKIPFQLVPPRVWKKEFSLDNDKQKSIETCQRLFPDVNLIPPRCRKPHDGEAESLLLATYASRHF